MSEVQPSRRQFLKWTGLAALAIGGGWKLNEEYHVDVAINPRDDAGLAQTDTLPETQTDPEETTEAPATYFPQFGIDTSRYQVDLMDPRLLLANGISYQIAKATRGVRTFDDHPKDPLFAASRENAQEAGLLFGAYHFLNRGDGRAQAEAYLEFLDQTGGTDNIICALDVENDPKRDQLGLPTYDDVLAFTDTFQQHINDRPLLIYTGGYWRKPPSEGGLGNPSQAPANSRLWHAHWVPIPNVTPRQAIEGSPAAVYPHISYPGTPDDAYPSNAVANYPHYTIRQLTSKGHVPRAGGGEHVMDIDISYLPFEALKQLAGPKAQAVESTPFLAPEQALQRASAPDLAALAPR